MVISNQAAHNGTYALAANRSVGVHLAGHRRLIGLRRLWIPDLVIAMRDRLTEPAWARSAV